MTAADLGDFPLHGRELEVKGVAFFQNLSGARFERPPADVFRLRAVLRSNPEATPEFFVAREGMIPRERFFNPENLTALFARTTTPGV